MHFKRQTIMKLNQQRQAITRIMLIALTILFCRTPPLSAAEGLLVVNSALNMQTAPLWVAKQKGYFYKYGLDVDTIYIPSGTMAMQALLAGETKILVADGSSVVNARLRGASVKIFIGMVNFYPNPFFSTPDIKSYADLKGKKIAVTRIGSLSYTATVMLMKKLGLEEGLTIRCCNWEARKIVSRRSPKGRFRNHTFGSGERDRPQCWHESARVGNRAGETRDHDSAPVC
jgi:ABC-type taurine transport system substrate-binding protein